MEWVAAFILLPVFLVAVLVAGIWAIVSAPGLWITLGAAALVFLVICLCDPRERAALKAMLRR